MELFSFLMRILFVVFATSTLGFFIYALYDAYQDLRATDYARHKRPGMYRAADEIAARDMVRNNWYRSVSMLLLSLIALIILFIPAPRDTGLNILLYFMMVGVPATKLLNAIQERRAKTTLRKRLRDTERERIKYEY